MARTKESKVPHASAKHNNKDWCAHCEDWDNEFGHAQLPHLNYHPPSKKSHTHYCAVTDAVVRSTRNVWDWPWCRRENGSVDTVRNNNSVVFILFRTMHFHHNVCMI